MSIEGRRERGAAEREDREQRESRFESSQDRGSSAERHGAARTPAESRPSYHEIVAILRSLLAAGPARSRSPGTKSRWLRSATHGHLSVFKLSGGESK